LQEFKEAGAARSLLLRAPRRASVSSLPEPRRTQSKRQIVSTRECFEVNALAFDDGLLELLQLLELLCLPRAPPGHSPGRPLFSSAKKFERCLSEQPSALKNSNPLLTYEFLGSGFGTGGGQCALGRRFWSPADGVRIGPMGHMGPMGRKLRTANRQNPNVQGRSGVPTRAACVSRLATLFAGHPRTGSLCSMGPPHRVDWRLSRPVLMVFANEVSEKSPRTHEFIFLLDPHRGR
jgi:hypothetical protein